MSTSTCASLYGGTCAQPVSNRAFSWGKGCRYHGVNGNGVNPATAGPSGDAGAVAAAPQLNGGNGEWQVLEYLTRTEGGGRSWAYGGPKLRQDLDAYPVPDDVENQLEAARKNHEKVTVLVQTTGTTFLGFEVATTKIYSGELFRGEGQVLGILPGRSTRNGRRVGGLGTRVLDVLPGTGVKNAEKLNARLHAASGLPPVAPVADSTEERAEQFRSASWEQPVAVLYDHPGFEDGADDGAGGCVWLVTGYDAENDIVDGYLWTPDDSGLFSEFGSIYGRQLERGARVIQAKPKIDVAHDDLDALPGDRKGCYQALFG